MKFKKELLLIIPLILLFALALWYGWFNIFLIVIINLLILMYLLISKLNIKLFLLIIIQWLIYLTALITHKYFIELPGSGNDDVRFEKLAIGYYNHLALNMNVNVFQSSTAYSKLLSFVYFLGKPFEILPGLINITVHTICVILLYKIVVNVFGNEKVAIISSYLFVLYPLTLINTVITLREIYVILFVLIFTLAILKYHDSKRILYLFISILAIVLGSIFHVGMVGLLAVLGVYFCLFSKQNFLFKSIVVIVSLLALLLFITKTDNTKIQNSIGTGETMEVNEMAGSRADYISPAERGGLSTKVKQEVFFAFKPFPWEVRTASDMIGFINILLIVISFILGIKIYRKTKNQKVLIILIIVALSFMVFALGTYNYGSALRHRDKTSLLLIMFICQYYFGRKKLNEQ